METSALKKAEITIPESTRWSRDISPWLLASRYVVKEAMRLKTKAAAWIGNWGKRATERAHPNAAPDDRPKIKGSTSGLRNMPCSVTPAPERAAPTSADKIILGSLISHSMDSSVPASADFRRKILENNTFAIVQGAMA